MIATGVFFGAAVLGLAVLGLRADWTLQKEIEAIRAKGEPVTPQELRRRSPEPSKGQNAAETYTKPFSAVKPSDDAWQREERVRNTSTKDLFAGEFRKWVDGHLAENAEALALLHEAAHKPAAQFPVTLGKGWYGEGFPDIRKIGESATLLQLEALVAAQAGDTARVLEAVLAGLALGNALSDNPLIRLLTTRFECYMTTCEGIRHALSLAVFSDDQLAQMQRALDAANDDEAVTRALIGERVETLIYFDHPEYRFSDIRQFNDWMPGAGAAAATLMRVAGNHGAYLSLMGQAIDASRRPSWEAAPLLRTLEIQHRGRSRGFGFPVNIMLSQASYGEQRLMMGTAQARSAQVALAVERYRLANGRVPEDAGQLVPAFLPAIPTDPCSGQPLRYWPSEDGYMVYYGGGGSQDKDSTAAYRSNGDYGFQVTHTQ